jgi:hypothetical protein
MSAHWMDDAVIEKRVLHTNYDQSLSRIRARGSD